MAVVKKLTKIGNSAALVIDRTMLGLLGMDNQTPVEISMGPDGASLIVRPVRNAQENRRLFEEARKEGNRRNAGALKKLADQ